MLETLLQPDDTEERCGVVMKDGVVIELRNVAADPRVSFEMEPVAFLELMKSEQVSGTWHTHPHGPNTLSGADYTSFLNWPDVEHHIIGREGVTTYRVDDGVILTCD